ncbi:unnamed protein product [Spirodela intermedia]|uniref:Macro domain-containing protein n=1 Tax=Spirodela intermedia TaxID=51605 RepID=A0A7I8JGM6_SPIIN|nr:unnamed protein product [Spirodela intermedia]CAA6669309.1 unnamed protein product [Spirodela intermedia]
MDPLTNIKVGFNAGVIGLGKALRKGSGSHPGGRPGSGKSTFCENVMRAGRRPGCESARFDNIANGKPGRRSQCIKTATEALKDGKSIFIDRCNLDREQRAEFVALGGPQAELHAVVLNLPARVCISRSVKRSGHEGNLQGGRAAAVVNRMLHSQEFPEVNEGFSRITFCQSDAEVRELVNSYGSLGPSDSLPMAALARGTQIPKRRWEELPHSGSQGRKQDEEEVGTDDGSRTLAFPSISTADFQFDHEKASDIIVDSVADFLARYDGVRLVLVDLTPSSNILSLVKSKASMRKIDSRRFFTFVGDITRLLSRGSLHCSVIANAANWRLKPGGGGVNAAIFSAAGGALEAATKEQAGTLVPGSSVAVHLPSSSPLHQREGVTHVIHVLGPNMNPQRPNCLGGDYEEGCGVLRAAYSSLFCNFISVVQAHSERNKKQKGEQEQKYEDGSGERKKKKAWGSWAQSLHRFAMEPEKHGDVAMEISDDFVILPDLYPKMHEAGMRCAAKFLSDDPSLTFRLGYHSAPSMRQLHLHVISQDFDSDHLKNKKHWNSFNTAFFLDSGDVLEAVERNGAAELASERLLSAELRCHRCRSAHPNVPKLKAIFPSVVPLSRPSYARRPAGVGAARPLRCRFVNKMYSVACCLLPSTSTPYIKWPAFAASRLTRLLRHV